jgi:hypothetical protein
MSENHEVREARERELTTAWQRIVQLSAALDAANAELTMWREGGVTEELLRKNNGFIRIGNGCAIVRANEVEGGAQ